MKSTLPPPSLTILIGAAICCLVPGAIRAQDLKASLAYLPKISESPDKGAFVDLVKAIGGVYTSGTIQISVSPMARSIDNVISGGADFHIPMIRNTVVPASALPYKCSTEALGKVVFVIYSNKAKPITLNMLKAAKDQKPFPYQFESGRGLEAFFDFPVTPSNAIDQSLKKVDAGRVDGFIWAQEEADYTVRTLALKNVHRAIYFAFDDIIVLPKGPKGDKLDAEFTKLIKLLRESGKLQKLYATIHLPYNDWQP